MTTLPQDLLLLLLDPETARPVAEGVRVKYALAGAVLTDLALAGRVAVTEGTPVRVVDASPTGDPVLDWGLRELTQDKPRASRASLTRLASGVRDVAVDQLVDQQVVVREHGKVTGFAPIDQWDPQVSDRVDQLPIALQAAVASSELTEAQLRDAILLALMAASGTMYDALPWLEWDRAMLCMAKGLEASDASVRDITASVAGCIATAQTGGDAQH